MAQPSLNDISPDLFLNIFGLLNNILINILNNTLNNIVINNLQILCVANMTFYKLLPICFFLLAKILKLLFGIRSTLPVTETGVDVDSPPQHTQSTSCTNELRRSFSHTILTDINPSTSSIIPQSSSFQHISPICMTLSSNKLADSGQPNDVLAADDSIDLNMATAVSANAHTPRPSIKDLKYKLNIGVCVDEEELECHCFEDEPLTVAWSQLPKDCVHGNRRPFISPHHNITPIRHTPANVFTYAEKTQVIRERYQRWSAAVRDFNSKKRVEKRRRKRVREHLAGKKQLSAANIVVWDKRPSKSHHSGLLLSLE